MPVAAKPRVALSSNSGGFTPSDLSGLVVWLAADKITGLSDGNAVTTWADSSGQANDAVQNTAANKPTYKTNIVNGKPVVRFDSVDDYLTIADSATYKVGSISVFVVADIDAADSDSWVVLGYPHNTTHADPWFRWVLFRAFTSPNYYMNARFNGTGANGANRTFSGFEYHEYYNADGDTFINGTVDINTTGASLTYPNAVGIYIGANSSVGEQLNGDIAEIIIYDSNLSAANRTKVRDYITEKYNL